MTTTAVSQENGTHEPWQAFTFGDPVPVLNGRELGSYMECWYNGKWYEPQFSMEGLSRSYKATPYLATGIIFKRNFLANLFVPNRYLSRKDFEQIALDFLWCGNAYLERIVSRLGSVLQFKPSLAKYMRVGENDTFYSIQTDHKGYQEHEFAKGTICQLREADIDQEIYGSPEYLSALQSAWLNESATLFRRKYYNNGSHAGFILYLTDPAHNEEDVNALRAALKESKGPGNFRNLFFYSPQGKKDGIQIIPVSEIAAKDEFANIKSITRDDMLAIQRIPPPLLGIVPNNTGGFGNIRDAAEVFWHNEAKPLQSRMMMINEWAGMELIKFKDYELPTGSSQP